jgi:membrane peptidoglycan carboxypeptidase
MRLKRSARKRLGGLPPKRRRRFLLGGSGGPRRELSSQFITMLLAGLFIMGLVGGFAWAQDRQVRGGVLLQRAEAAQREDWVSMESLPSYVPHAFLVAVDPEFEQAGTLRAGQDGTTVARDLIRQIHLLGDGLRSSAREMVMAPVLEQRTSKRGLLELYLNRVYLGRSQDYPVYGIYWAAEEYLGKRPEELTLGEAATLAGLLLEPRITDPDDRPGAVGARRNELLRLMLLSGYITPEEHRAAVSERLAFQPGLREFPMTRRIPTPRDDDVIRLPPQYQPQPEPTDPE